MWFSRLKRTISHASGVNRRLRVLAHCTPPNPPPTITTRLGAVAITPAAYSKNRATTRDDVPAAFFSGKWLNVRREAGVRSPRALLVSGQSVRRDKA
jgi:hypothetical protein